ncbi:MAG: electron transfer flavoprotein subunit beta/FixA family protein [Thermodesulfobacteriota bacterium]|nr:electron transfer flavoprotein subunit beta/FixA family protein [Thermodesulfobacteriota bacterium]
MDIVVCIKQVPDTTNVKIDPETHTLIREGVKSIINPFDLYAIEEGLRLKERFSGQVTVMTMGPPQAEESLREALSYGVDDVVLLSDKRFAGADTIATSFTLMAGVQKIEKFDLILCGRQAIDGDTAQVPPSLAERLNIPYVTYVRKIRNFSEGIIEVERMMDDGYDVVEMKLPGLISVVKEINEPRMPSLRGMARAKSYDIKLWNMDDLNISIDHVGLKGSPTQVIKVFSPPKREKREFIEASTIEEKVDVLFEKLKSTGSLTMNTQ